MQDGLGGPVKAGRGPANSTCSTIKPSTVGIDAGRARKRYRVNEPPDQSERTNMSKPNTARRTDRRGRKAKRGVRPEVPDHEVLRRLYQLLEESEPSAAVGEDLINDASHHR